jgi:hypothetical protein
MPTAAPPISVRVSPEERGELELVARYMQTTLSELIRETMTNFAADYLDHVGRAHVVKAVAAEDSERTRRQGERWEALRRRVEATGPQDEPHSYSRSSSGSPS